MSENFPGMTGKARFLEVYEHHLAEQVRLNPGRFWYGPEKVHSTAAKMVDNLALNLAEVKGSEAVRATCKELGIKCTKGAVVRYIRHGPDA